MCRLMLSSVVKTNTVVMEKKAGLNMYAAVLAEQELGLSKVNRRQ